MRKRSRGHDRRILDADVVMSLVTLLEAAQNRDGVFYVGLAHEHDLEAPFERGILLDVFAIFIQRGRADGPQLAPRQRRLQHIRSIDGAFRRACPYQGVQLIDEQNDLAIRLFNVLEHRLEPVFKLAAILRSRQHGAKVERDHALVAQQFGHIAGDDTPRQAFDNGGLAHARFPNQHRVVLRPARKHLDHAANLFIPADDRIQFSPPRQLREVLGIAVQSLVFAFGILIGDPLIAAHRGECLQNRVPGGSQRRQQHLRRVLLILCQGQQQMLGRYVLVLEVLRLFRSLVQYLLHA